MMRVRSGTDDRHRCLRKVYRRQIFVGPRIGASGWSSKQALFLGGIPSPLAIAFAVHLSRCLPSATHEQRRRTGSCSAGGAHAAQ
jgi:hypothetical protein